MIDKNSTKGKLLSWESVKVVIQKYGMKDGINFMVNQVIQNENRATVREQQQSEDMAQRSVHN